MPAGPSEEGLRKTAMGIYPTRIRKLVGQRRRSRRRDRNTWPSLWPVHFPLLRFSVISGSVVYLQIQAFLLIKSNEEMNFHTIYIV